VKVAFRDAGAAAAPFLATSRDVRIPKSAVRLQDGHDIVFVVRDRRAERRAVTVAAAQDQEALISAGLVVGEKVVLEPTISLSDGAAITEKNP
jgi:hypothetical protein